MTQCSDIRDDLSELLDGELDEDRRREVEDHLAMCDGCLGEARRMQHVDRLYRELPRQPLPAGFESSVRDRMRPRLVRLATSRRPRAALWPALAAAVVLFIGSGVALLGLHGGRHMAPTQMARVSDMEADSHAPRQAAEIAGRESMPEQEAHRLRAAPPPGAAPESTDAGLYEHRVAPPAEDAGPATLSRARVDPVDREKTMSTPSRDTETPAAEPVPMPLAAPELPAPEAAARRRVQAEIAEEQLDAPERAEDVAEGLAYDRAMSPPPGARGMGGMGGGLHGGVVAGYGLNQSDVDAFSRALRAGASPHLGPPTAEGPGRLPGVHIGGRVLAKSGDGWVEDGYRDEETVTIVRGTPEAEAFLERHPDTAALFRLGDEVIFRVRTDGEAAAHWYRLLPAEARD